MQSKVIYISEVHDWGLLSLGWGEAESIFFIMNFYDPVRDCFRALMFSAKTSKRSNCSFCHKTFTYRKSLHRHIKTHADQREKFRCNECGKELGQLSDLARHKKVSGGHSIGVEPCSYQKPRFITAANSIVVKFVVRPSQEMMLSWGITLHFTPRSSWSSADTSANACKGKSKSRSEGLAYMIW